LLHWAQRLGPPGQQHEPCHPCIRLILLRFPERQGADRNSPSTCRIRRNALPDAGWRRIDTARRTKRTLSTLSALSRLLPAGLSVARRATAPLFAPWSAPCYRPAVTLRQ